MNEPAPSTPANPATERNRLLELLLAALAVVLLAAFIVFYDGYLRIHAGPEQPIAFSHRFHAGAKQIGCLMCHESALRSERAGIPPLQRCMLCHEEIIVTFPEIAKLREHYFGGRPVEWVRVNDLPDFVYFDHSMHLLRGVDCGRCHGDVRSMDRIVNANQLNMGFCIECHRDSGATHDCFTCHR